CVGKTGCRMGRLNNFRELSAVPVVEHLTCKKFSPKPHEQNKCNERNNKQTWHKQYFARLNFTKDLQRLKSFYLVICHSQNDADPHTVFSSFFRKVKKRDRKVSGDKPHAECSVKE